jgi:peptidoglycan hydrolase-like protein with peptidoglycan-binding domain
VLQPGAAPFEVSYVNVRGIAVHTRRLRRVGVVMTIALCLSMVAGAAIVSVGAPDPAAAESGSVVGLHLGSQGRSVREVQQALVRHGIKLFGGADGIYGLRTAAAVKAFQRRSGLSQTGTVDEATARALGLTGGSTPATGVVGLRRGGRGSEVKTVQRALEGAGYRLVGGADGIFGPSTESAVRAFQRARGLSPTGVVDAPTAEALGVVSSSPRIVGLREGARGDAVRAVQLAIVRAGGFLLGGVDGIFGPGTTSAVKAYQIVNGLRVTGVIDAATARVMQITLPKSDRRTRRPSTPPSRSYVGLRIGSRGEYVRRLQQALMRNGVYVLGGADGIFGPATGSAVRQFQSREGLSATGTVDRATARALGLISGGGNPSPGTSPYAGLRRGSTGWRVKEVQRALMRTGLVLLGGADGIFGPATESALKLFQKVNGLSVTGVVSDATARVMGLGTGPQPGVTPPGYPSYGERSSRVVALQRALLRAGISFAGGADGSFGAATTGAIIRFQQMRGLPVNGKVDAGTARALGLEPMAKPPPLKETVRISRFPVEPPCWYGDTWLDPRGGGRLHLGADVIADQGNRLYAVDDGRITTIYRDEPGSLSGNALKITRSDGTYFFYAHLSRFARGIGVGVPVEAGQVVGYVGSTGNSAGPHLHFEVHPRGGSAINPYPILKAVDRC